MKAHWKVCCQSCRVAYNGRRNLTAACTRPQLSGPLIVSLAVATSRRGVLWQKSLLLSREKFEGSGGLIEKEIEKRMKARLKK
jgi:hypothetical protein